MNKSKLPDCVVNHISFQKLSSEELLMVEKKHRIVKYKEGELVIKQGSHASQVLFLNKGLVKVFISQQGQENIISLEPASSFLGIAAITGSNVYPYSVIAVENLEACLLGMSDFLELMRSNGAFTTEILVQMNEYLQHAFKRMHCLLNKQINGRFATIMLCLLDRIYKTHKFTLTLSRKDLAELMAMSVESLSRLIKEFNDDNIVRITGKEVEVLDVDKLRNIEKTG